MNRKQLIILIYSIILIIYLSFSACKLENPEFFSIADIFQFDESLADRLILNANGIDHKLITVNISGDTPDGQLITFRTDTGAFASKPITSGDESAAREIQVSSSGNKAQVYLISGIEEKRGMISASLENHTIYKEVYFKRVVPERIVLRTDTTQLVANGNDTAKISVELIAPKSEYGRGIVTKDTRIIFTAVDLDTGREVPGLKRETLSNDKGVAETTITGRHVGTVEIIGTVEGENISDSVIILFVAES